MLRVPEVCREPESRSGFHINSGVSAFHMDAKGSRLDYGGSGASSANSDPRKLKCQHLRLSFVCGLSQPDLRCCCVALNMVGHT